MLKEITSYGYLVGGSSRVLEPEISAWAEISIVDRSKSQKSMKNSEDLELSDIFSESK